MRQLRLIVQPHTQLAQVANEIVKWAGQLEYLQVGGQIGGTSTAPLIIGLTESGGTQLTIGAIGDGQLLKRVGNQIIGVDP